MREGGGALRGEAIVETRGSDTPYQTVVRFATNGRRIHIFWRGDADPDCHDHPADFWTFPLVSYVEEFWDRGQRRRRVVRAFRLHCRRAEFAHRLVGAWSGFDLGTDNRPIVTLVWWGKKRREWGFHTAKGWTPWRTYLGLAPETPTPADAGSAQRLAALKPTGADDGPGRKNPHPPTAGEG